MLLKDGNVLEMMQGQYNSYGCCFKEMGGVARQPCPVHRPFVRFPVSCW